MVIIEADGWVTCDFSVYGIWTLFEEVTTGSTSHGGKVLLILLDTVDEVDATGEGDDARVDEETLDIMEYLEVMVSIDGGAEMVHGSHAISLTKFQDFSRTFIIFSRTKFPTLLKFYVYFCIHHPTDMIRPKFKCLLK